MFTDDYIYNNLHYQEIEKINISDNKIESDCYIKIDDDTKKKIKNNCC